MFDPRIYRAGFLPALAAFVALLFSLEPTPEPIEAPLTTSFEGGPATREARTIATLAPSRTPGSSDDELLAGRVQERFEGIPGGEVSVQKVDSSWDGADVSLKNVLLTLPGDLEDVLLIVAPRDSAEGPAAAGSASDTAVLLALADDLGGSRHNRTIVLASTSGLANGGAGVRALVDQLEAPAGIEAAIVLAHTGLKDGSPPFVYPGVARPESPLPRLRLTAEQLATVQFEQKAAEGGGWSDLSRLAFPVGIGEGAALDEEGVDAITVSGGGERPPDLTGSEPDSISGATIQASGETALELILAIDDTPAGALAGGPGTYVRIGDNLLPAWTLTLLTLTLLLPSLLAAGDVFLRDRRRSPRAAARAVPWALERALLPLAALLLVYLLGLVGLLPDPDFPYDPGRYPPGGEGPLAIVAIVLAIALAALLIRPFRTPLDTEPQTLAAMAGLLICASIAVIWISNPYLALLLAPAAHVWLLPARASGPPRKPLIALLCVLVLLPTLAAGLTAGSALELGWAAPWHLLLLIVGGQFGLLLPLSWCVLLGGLLCCVAAANVDLRLNAMPEPAHQRVRGPSGHAGPGSLGGTPSGISRR